MFTQENSNSGNPITLGVHCQTTGLQTRESKVKSIVSATMLTFTALWETVQLCSLRKVTTVEI